MLLVVWSLFAIYASVRKYVSFGLCEEGRGIFVPFASEPSINMTSSSSRHTMSSTSLEISLSKSHLHDISIKLASNNYLMRKAQNEVPCPESTITDENGELKTNPAAAVWLRTDQLILGWINSSLCDGPLSQVINSESSQDAWQALETLYGKPIGDDEFIICILRRLGSEFDPIVALNARDVFPSIEGTRFPHQTRNSIGTCRKQISHNSSRGRGGITCFRCGGPNHKTDGCFASNEEAEQYKAFAAIKIGETIEEAWYSDTRANQHMIPDINDIQGIVSYPRNDSVMVGNGQDLSISDTRHILLHNTNLKLKDVLVSGVDKPLATTPQISYHVQDEETTQDESASQTTAADLISTSTSSSEIPCTSPPAQSNRSILMFQQQLSKMNSTTTAPHDYTNSNKEAKTQGNSSSQITKLIANLSVVFHMKDLGDIHYFLGLQITRDESAITIT
uniref:Reverse transcriptase Ty1/copia-type domain-containing protein n=1 Tax=Salix viminalis TaxID=40686 RepID=A0A6N2MIK5_SALVM